MAMEHRLQPLYEAPHPYFTAHYHAYFSLRHETIFRSLLNVLENDPVFLYVESGLGRILINGESFSLSPGCTCLIQSFHIYSIFASDFEPLHLSAIVIDYPLLSYCNFTPLASDVLQEWYYVIPCVCCSPDSQAEFRELLNKCEREDQVQDNQASFIKTALYYQIHLLFRREATQQGQEKAQRLPVSWAAWVYLTQASATQIKPTDIAEKFGISVSQLNQELRKLTTYNCRQLLVRARICIAASMLLFSDLSMRYIANYVGFSSENSFYRSFKEWRGITPQECREQMLSQSNRYPRSYIHERPYAILNYICNNYRDPISLKTASRDLFLSESAINQISMEFFQRPFYQMVTRWRMLYAEALLRCTSLPICDVAMNAGFNSTHTFSRLFKQIYHVTPKQYQNERKAASDVEFL